MDKAHKDNKKNQTFRDTIESAKYTLGFILKEKYGKAYIFLKGLMSFINAIFPIIYTIMPGLIINELIGEQRIKTLILYAGILITAPLISQIINFVVNRRLHKLKLALYLELDVKFLSHVAKMDYETLEKPDIQILKNRAFDAVMSILQIVDYLSNLLLAIFSLIAISTIVATLNPLIILLIIGIIYMNSLVTKGTNYEKHITSQTLSQHDSFHGSCVYMLEQFSYAKERRIFNISLFLINRYKKSKTESNKLELKYQLFNQGIPDTFKAFTMFIQQLALYAYLIYCVIKKGLPVGNMTIYLSAAGQFSDALDKIFNSYLNLANNSLKIHELMEFMNIPLKEHETGNKTPEYDKQSVIEFKNVSFKYPGSEIYALKNLNLTLRSDEKLCIVGVNGSGKSTFVKLLTRLYSPTEGEILLNGVNINEYDYKKYQRLFAPVFQDFSKYFMTFEENIVLANEFNLERLDKVCAESGLMPLKKKLPKGYDTQADKWVDEEGFYPSGGEGQRMAIARACYHGGEVFLLDEPTAALDPVAEYEIYTQFNNMITDKTAVMITHRLSAVQLADKVAVFHKGNIIEYGTHKELYGHGGVYTEMFDKQSQFYRDEHIENSPAV